MPKFSTLTLKPFMFNVAKILPTAIIAKSDMVNILEEAPVKDTPYTVKGIKFGRPSFRLKRRGGMVFPSQMPSGLQRMKPPEK